MTLASKVYFCLHFRVKRKIRMTTCLPPAQFFPTHIILPLGFEPCCRMTSDCYIAQLATAYCQHTKCAAYQILCTTINTLQPCLTNFVVKLDAAELTYRYTDTALTCKCCQVLPYAHSDKCCSVNPVEHQS